MVCCSVQKYCKQGAEIEGNMWHSDQFAQYLAETTGDPDQWVASVRPSLQTVVVDTLRCFQEIIVDRSALTPRYS